MQYEVKYYFFDSSIYIYSAIFSIYYKYISSKNLQPAYME